MNSKKYLLLIGMLSVGLIVEAGILIYSCSTSSERPPLPPENTMEKTIDDRPRETPGEASARREIRELKREIAALKMKSQLQSSNTASSDKEADNGSEKISPDLRKPVLTQDEAVNERFNGEQVDRKWAAEIEDRLDELFDDELLRNSRIEYLECRSTLCKLNVTHPTKADQEAFLGRMETDSPQFQEVGITPYWNEEDGYGADCYIIRKGAPILSAGQGRTSVIDEIQKKLRNGQVVPQTPNGS